MAKKTTYYFQHDYNARNDPKLQEVLIELGVVGIGVFWCIVEQMYEQGGRLELKSCKSIAFALHLDCKIIESVVNDFDLFENDGVFFWSNSIKSRLEKVKSISESRKNAAKTRWKSDIKNQMQCNSNANAHQMQCNSNAKKRKEYNKESISKDIPKKSPPAKKEDEKKAYAEYVLLTEKEHKKLIEEYGDDVVKELIDILDCYKGSKGVKYKSDYMAIRGWVKDKYNEQQNQSRKYGKNSIQRSCEPPTIGGDYTTSL